MAQVAFVFQDSSVEFECRSVAGRERLGEATALQIEAFSKEPIDSALVVGKPCREIVPSYGPYGLMAHGRRTKLSHTASRCANVPLHVAYTRCTIGPPGILITLTACCFALCVCPITTKCVCKSAPLNSASVSPTYGSGPVSRLETFIAADAKYHAAAGGAFR